MINLESENIQSIKNKFFSLAKKFDAYFIVRIQIQKSILFEAANGELKSSSFNTMAGIGIQSFTPNGGFGFTSSDNLDENSLESLMEKSFLMSTMVEGNSEYYQTLINIPILNEKQEKPKSFIDMDLELIKNSFIKFHNNCLELDTISLTSNFNTTENDWLILRSDGTDLTYYQISSYIMNKITANQDGKKASVNVKKFGKDISLIIDQEFLDTIKKRMIAGINNAIQLCNAKKVKAGNYNIVIDYALSKGLAHESIGHAASSSSMSTSCLSKDKLFIVGEKIAPDYINIEDESINFDHAYQPYSAYAIPRKKVKVIENGIFKEPLLDILNAHKLSGLDYSSDRAESYLHIPQSRMSNIILRHNNPIDITVNFEDITPEILREIMIENNLLPENETTLYLSGYKGGQTNSSKGSFVFNTRIVYDITNEKIETYKPAIFAGNGIAALNAIVAAIGPIINDELGFCGQDGQKVNSSGGGNAFFVLKSHKDITIGGKNESESEE